MPTFSWFNLHNSSFVFIKNKTVSTNRLTLSAHVIQCNTLYNDEQTRQIKGENS